MQLGQGNRRARHWTESTMSWQLQRCPATLDRLLEKPGVAAFLFSRGCGQGFALSHPNSISYFLVNTPWLPPPPHHLCVPCREKTPGSFLTVPAGSSCFCPTDLLCSPATLSASEAEIWFSLLFCFVFSLFNFSQVHIAIPNKSLVMMGRVAVGVGN